MPPQFTVASLGDIVGAQKTYREAQQERQLHQDEQEAKKIIVESNGNMPIAIDNLRRRGMVVVAQRLETSMVETRKKMYDALKVDIENRRAVSDDVAQILGSVKDPETHKSAYDKIALKWGPEAAAEIGEQYNPNVIAMNIAEGTAVTEQNRIKEKAAELVREAPTNLLKQRGSVATLLASADDDDDWQAIRGWLKSAGVDDASMAWVPPAWSTEAQKAMYEASLTPEQKEQRTSRQADDTRADEAAERAEAAAEETRRRNKELQSNADRTYNLAVRREGRVASGGDDGEGAGADRVARRTAETWRANQLAQLAARERGGTGPGERALTPQQIEAEQERIEASYRQMAGLPPAPDNAQYPAGVKKYVRDLKRKYKNFPEADAELTRAMESIVEAHPSVDEQTVRTELANQYGAQPSAPTQPRQKVQYSKGPQQPQKPGQPQQPGQGSSVKKEDVQVGKTVRLQDGRTIRVKKVEGGKITDYDVIGQ